MSLWEKEAHFQDRTAWETAARQCRACHLREEGNAGPVLSTGDVHAPLMIVGEGPGGVEDEYGAPLVGPFRTAFG